MDAKEFPHVLPPLRPLEEVGFQEAVRQFDCGFMAERMKIGMEAGRLVRALKTNFSNEQRKRSVVSFLIDHSGSMRGLRMLSAVLAVECAVDALAQAGIDTEILGFTTSTWKGGRSREAWQWAGRPRNPGRLCDLRHIVYASADREGPIPWRLRFAFRPDLLRENIDGEALEWAAGRLRPARWDRRVICVVSDGVPVDDSTLLANRDDPEILTRHLEVTERKLADLGGVVGFLFLGDEHGREPPLHERAAEGEEAGLALVKLVRRSLLGTSGEFR